jgi:hypothetical protein
MTDLGGFIGYTPPPAMKAAEALRSAQQIWRDDDEGNGNNAAIAPALIGIGLWLGAIYEHLTTKGSPS